MSVTWWWKWRRGVCPSRGRGKRRKGSFDCPLESDSESLSQRHCVSDLINSINWASGCNPDTRGNHGDSQDSRVDMYTPHAEPFGIRPVKPLSRLPQRASKEQFRLPHESSTRGARSSSSRSNDHRRETRQPRRVSEHPTLVLISPNSSSRVNAS